MADTTLPVPPDLMQNSENIKAFIAQLSTKAATRSAGVHASLFCCDSVMKRFMMTMSVIGCLSETFHDLLHRIDRFSSSTGAAHGDTGANRRDSMTAPLYVRACSILRHRNARSESPVREKRDGMSMV